MMWGKIFILTYLAILAVKDGREQKIPLWWLLVGAVVLSGIGIYQCVTGGFTWSEMVMGMIPGIFFLAVAWITGKAGMADGLVLIELGLCLGYKECLALCGFGLLLLAVVSSVLLFLHKVRKNTKMPYLPFLAIVYLLRLM
uniref:hypothetical protein n=1 Tax=Acetatifactor sp. TaxID=1872090 RepID=UPI004056F38E